MNPDVLLNRIRLEQRGLIDIHKKLYEMEHLLPAPDQMQFAKTAESAALLSEKSTARLRNMFFSVSNEPPIYYYPKAAEVQGIRVWASDNYLRVLLPALLPDKKKRDGCKFLLLPLQAALVQSGPLPHFSDCVICVEHIYDHNLPIKAVRDYDNLELKAPFDIECETPLLLAAAESQYSGVTRKGVHALALQVSGIPLTAVATRMSAPPNHVSAWISRAVHKLRNDESFLSSLHEN